jgi:hypothetical protein
MGNKNHLSKRHHQGRRHRAQGGKLVSNQGNLTNLLNIMDNNKNWIDQRFPLTKVWNEHLAEYYTPRNFNFWYFFGSLAMLVLVMQIVESKSTLVAICTSRKASHDTYVDK